MRSSLKLTLTTLAAALLLAGCASQSTAPTAAVPVAAPTAADLELASKLKGQWNGEWSISSVSGKFVLVVTAVEGNTLKGEAQWYGTAKGDTKEPLNKASVQGGELTAAQPGGTAFKLKLKDAKTLDGTWSVSGYNGPLTATRQ